MKHIINIFIVFIMLLTCSVILFYFLDQKREKGFEPLADYQKQPTI